MLTLVEEAFLVVQEALVVPQVSSWEEAGAEAVGAFPWEEAEGVGVAIQVQHQTCRWEEGEVEEATLVRPSGVGEVEEAGH